MLFRTTKTKIRLDKGGKVLPGYRGFNEVLFKELIRDAETPTFGHRPRDLFDYFSFLRNLQNTFIANLWLSTTYVSKTLRIKRGLLHYWIRRGYIDHVEEPDKKENQKEKPKNKKKGRTYLLSWVGITQAAIIHDFRKQGISLNKAVEWTQVILNSVRRYQEKNFMSLFIDITDTDERKADEIVGDIDGEKLNKIVKCTHDVFQKLGLEIVWISGDVGQLYYYREIDEKD